MSIKYRIKIINKRTRLARGRKHIYSHLPTILYTTQNKENMHLCFLFNQINLIISK